MPRGHIDGLPTFMGDPPFKVGDRVVLDHWYYSVRVADNYIIRKIAKVWLRYDQRGDRDWAATVDGGDPCDKCGLTPGNFLKGFAASWFRLATPEEIERRKRDEFPPDPDDEEGSS